jgi:hypothetical protein
VWLTCNLELISKGGAAGYMQSLAAAQAQLRGEVVLLAGQLCLRRY